MKPPIRLVAIDLDGTLLDSKKQLHPVTAATIREVQELGVQVTLATGRTFGSTAPYARMLNIRLPVITHAGAYVAGLEDSRPLRETPVSPEAAAGVLRCLEQHDFYVKMYVGDHLYVQEATEETVQFSRKFGVPYTEVGRGKLHRLGKVPLKIVVIAAPERIRQAPALLSPWQEDCRLIRDSERGLEIVDRRVSKGAALQAICAVLAIPPTEVMAFGNEGNDLEMIRDAGIGVAMGDAYEELKRHARIIADTNDNLGVARVLSDFFLPGRHL